MLPVWYTIFLDNFYKMSSKKWDQPKIDHIADLTLYPMTIYDI